jgi:hypothetical protein
MLRVLRAVGIEGGVREPGESLADRTWAIDLPA